MDGPDEPAEFHTGHDKFDALKAFCHRGAVVEEQQDACQHLHAEQKQRDAPEVVPVGGGVNRNGLVAGNFAYCGKSQAVFEPFAGSHRSGLLRDDDFVTPQVDGVFFQRRGRRASDYTPAHIVGAVVARTPDLASGVLILHRAVQVGTDGGERLELGVVHLDEQGWFITEFDDLAGVRFQISNFAPDASLTAVSVTAGGFMKRRTGYRKVATDAIALPPAIHDRIVRLPS